MCMAPGSSPALTGFVTVFCGTQLNRAPVAQLVEHQVIMREVVSSTPAGPTLWVLK